MIPNPDDLDDLLGPTPPTANHDRVKEAILRTSTRQLARARWTRRGRTVVAAAALFTTGGVLAWFAKPAPEPLPTPEPLVFPVPIVQFVSPEPAPASSGEVFVSAEQVELQAEQATLAAEVARLYLVAGVRYEDRAEYAQAKRCYTLHLLAAGPAGRTVSTDDSWLLISVKTSLKEADRDRKQGS